MGFDVLRLGIVGETDDDHYATLDMISVFHRGVFCLEIDKNR